MSPSHSVQLGISGEDGPEYAVEISANLVTWQAFTTVQLSNGSASITYDAGSGTNVLFFRAYEEATSPETTLGFETSTDMSVGVLVTPDGGAAELMTPDFRHVRLTIPAGCVTAAQIVTMKLVTNVVGLPFSNGTFGSVLLEPEDFTLAGAASLEIDFPDGQEPRQLTSFRANADGTELSLVLDRFLTNRVLIPITRFGFYGSALARAGEVNGLLGQAQPAYKLAGGPAERISTSCPPARSDGEGPLHLGSAEDCFPVLVARAVEVRTLLNRVWRCNFLEPAARELSIARQQQLFGAPVDLASSVLARAITNACLIYTNYLAPLWTEAEQNCALGQDILKFTLGAERQLQLFDITLPCPFTLEDHFTNLCHSAQECLREVAVCCFEGRKGSARVGEALQTIKEFDYLGYDCFESNGETGVPYAEDPLMKPVFLNCLSNSWYGTLTVKQSGEYHSTTNYLRGTSGKDFVTETDVQSVNLEFSAQVYSSLDSVFAGGGPEFLDLFLTGQGTAQLRLTHTLNETIACNLIGGKPDPRQVTKFDHESHTETYGLTNQNSMTVTNDIATNTIAAYNLTFLLNTNNYQIVDFGSMITVTADSKVYAKNRSEFCDGKVTYSDDPGGAEKVAYVFPSFLALGPSEFPSTNRNKVVGSLTVTNSENAFSPVQVMTFFKWEFYKRTNSTDAPFIEKR